MFERLFSPTPADRAPSAAPAAAPRPDEDGDNAIVAAAEAIRRGRLGDLPRGPGRGLAALESLAEDIGRRAADELRRLVEHAGEVNGASTKAATVLTELREIGQETEQLASTTVEMHAIAADITGAIERSGTALHAVSGTTTSSVAAVASAVSGLDRVESALRQAEQRLMSLRAEAEAMGDLLGAVEAIAGQTRMLALNAMIEAERAGAAGGGFRVVANEVRSLADQTQRTTLTLRERIQALDGEVSGITAAMDETLAIVDEGRASLTRARADTEHTGAEIDGITRNIDEIAGAVTQQSQAADSLSQSATRLAHRSEKGVGSVTDALKGLDLGGTIIKERLDALAGIDVPGAMLWLARSDHVFWKRRVADRVGGFSDLRAEDLTDHTQCRFGKWCAGVDDPALRGHPAFAGLKDPHERVHRHGVAAVRAAEAGHGQQALADMAEMERASGELMGRLDQLSAWFLARRP